MPSSTPDLLSLYIHIPFCTTRCTYCAFNAYANLNHMIAPFIKALVKEIAIVAEQNPYKSVGTIYFGGGTPSLITPAQFDTLVSRIRHNFVVEKDVEISAETNPNDLSVEYLCGLRDAGINRLSIGMQSANVEELDLFARHHNHDATVQAVIAARSAKFDNLNLDLIYGIPHQTLEDWSTTLTQLITLDPEHVSMYALGLEPGTAMHTWVHKGKLPMPDDDLAADMYDLATSVMKQNNYAQYEISNWAKPGYDCQHNLQYWRNLPYLGFGPGAHGFAGGIRYSTVLSPQQYVEAMNGNRHQHDFPSSPATDEARWVTVTDEMSETLMMSLRLTREGVQRDVFRNRFGIDVMDLHGPMLGRFVADGLVDIRPDLVRLTERGRLLSNVVFRELV